MSGTTDNRPALQAMFAEAMRAGSGITEIGIYAFSRLFRDQYLLEHYRRKLARAGVKIVAITQEVGEGDEGDLVRSVLSKFDEYQSRQTGKFTRDNMRRNAQDGFWNGGKPPFGYVTQVAEMRGPKAKKCLVTHLNATGATLRGRKFHVSNVREILTRSSYRGRHQCFMNDTRAGTRRPEEEWEEVAVPIIIPEHDWLEVQATIARNASHITPARVVSGPTMLAGIAKCGHPDCGHALTIATGKGGRYRYYRCSRNLRRGLTDCEGTSIRDGVLETVVVDAIAERILRPERLHLLLADLLDPSSSSVHKREARLKALRTERTRIDAAIQNMFDFIEQGVISARDEDFTRRLSNNRARRTDFEQEIVLVEQQLASTERRVTPAAVERLGQVIEQRLRSSDGAVRQGYARRFIEKVVVAPQSITIHGSLKSLALATAGDPDDTTPLVPSSAREWCRLQDSNL